MPETRVCVCEGRIWHQKPQNIHTHRTHRFEEVEEEEEAVVVGVAHPLL